jgi:hypothetical protein
MFAMVGVVPKFNYRFRQAGDIRWVNQHRRASDRLFDRGNAACNYRCAASHRFKRR